MIYWTKSARNDKIMGLDGKRVSQTIAINEQRSTMR